ncbi:MAG: hypothetical protein FD144_2625 [Rhodospirillaceae bacterium]|nr:MAG: hypothetical protein FD144_2625 [Rhodospirillaceae bacterium]
MSVVPSTTMIGKEVPASFDVAKVVDDLIAELSPSLGDLRRMTAEEAEAFCADEEADEREGYIDLGLIDSDDEESGG